MTEGQRVGWHHQLGEHESEQIPGDSEGQGSLACCRPWGHKELDMTERLNNNKVSRYGLLGKEAGDAEERTFQKEYYA